jgi:hypothetical protein
MNKHDHIYTITKATCPTATQNIATNLKNRAKAIDVANYGPQNPAEPNDEYWQAKAKSFKGSVADAKSSRCGNCAAFIQTKEMLACIDKGLTAGDSAKENAWDTIKAGDLGYCEAFDFKCASKRTCDAWIAGGPVK